MIQILDFKWNSNDQKRIHKKCALVNKCYSSKQINKIIGFLESTIIFVIKWSTMKYGRVQILLHKFKWMRNYSCDGLCKKPIFYGYPQNLRDHKLSVYPKITLHFRKRTLHILKKTLHILKKTLHFFKKTLHFLKITLHFLKKTLSLNRKYL